MKSSGCYFLVSHRNPKTVALCLMLFVCCSIASCNQSIAIPTPTPPTLAVLPIQETYIQAESVALKWRPDAQLQSASFNIELWSAPDHMTCSYTFVSAMSHESLWIHLGTNPSGFTLDRKEDSWLAPIGTPISFEEINLESKEALQAIMDYGGRTFFERYQIREKQLYDYFNLSFERLDEQNGEGPIIWTAGFAIDNPHAQLYMRIEDATSDLLEVWAYGDREQEYWFRDITVTERIPIGESKNFFDLFDLRLDNITEENNRRYANFTIISPKTTWLTRGEVTHTHIKQNSMFPFDEYEITLVKIDREWIEVEVMPIHKWFKPRQAD